MRKSNCLYLSIFYFLFFSCFGVDVVFAKKCDQCWSPNLGFDIEGAGQKQSMVFISGYSYSLNSTTSLLRTKGQKNYFCYDGVITSKILINILNSKLNGTVTAEQVDWAIKQGLLEKYPCS